jgi:hypothetical protein
MAMARARKAAKAAPAPAKAPTMIERIKNLPPELQNIIRKMAQPRFTKEIKQFVDRYDMDQLAEADDGPIDTSKIDGLINAIQNSTTRLTNLQKNKFHYFLKKYPENELLLSIKHLVQAY